MRDAKLVEKKEKIKERQERFGIVTKESIEAKILERQKRFVMMDEAAQAGLSPDELEAKRKARLERFGKETIEESEKSIQKKRGGKGEDGLDSLGGFKPNRRKQKFNRKQQHKQGGGFKGKGNRSQSGNKFKRFKGQN